jgi:hypothetical protein
MIPFVRPTGTSGHGLLKRVQISENIFKPGSYISLKPIPGHLKDRRVIIPGILNFAKESATQAHCRQVALSQIN